jgi:uncharacterized membrane protein
MYEIGEPLSRLAWTLPLIFASLLLAGLMTAPAIEDVSALPKVDDATVLAIAGKHCVMCHARKPTHQAFTEPPKGTVLETLDDLKRHADLVVKMAVQTNTMPLGNETGMTPEERRALGLWLAQNR